MSIFSLLESVFFVFLGLSFVLILLMVYHFKKRMDMMERTNESLGDICKTVIQEIEQIKSSHYTTTDPQTIVYPPQFPKDPMYVSQQNESASISEEYLEEMLNSMMYHEHNLGMFANGHVSMKADNNDIEILSTDATSPSQLDVSQYENGELDDVESVVVETDATMSVLSDQIEEVAFGTESEADICETTDTIHVQKLDESDPLDDIISETGHTQVSTEANSEILTRKKLQKMNVQMLRTMVIREGYCTEPSKLKKLELIQMIITHQTQQFNELQE